MKSFANMILPNRKYAKMILPNRKAMLKWSRLTESYANMILFATPLFTIYSYQDPSAHAINHLCVAIFLDPA